MIWRDFTCLEWVDWTQFWMGFSVAVSVMIVGTILLMGVILYLDKKYPPYPRKDAHGN